MFHTNMDYNKYLLKAAEFTKDLKINKKDLELIMNTQLLFSQMADEKTRIKIAEMFKMYLNPFELYGKKQMEIGYEQGEIKKELEIAKNMKNIGFSDEDIIKSTGISDKDLKNL